LGGPFKVLSSSPNSSHMIIGSPASLYNCKNLTVCTWL